MDQKNKQLETQERKDQKRLTFAKAFNISIEFAFVIIVPLLVFVYAGKYLDARYNTKYFVLMGVVLALFSSSIWFYRIIKKLAQEIKDI